MIRNSDYLSQQSLIQKRAVIGSPFLFSITFCNTKEVFIIAIALFRYISSHIDEDGRFTATTLPDDPNPTVPRPFGSEDAFYYTTEFPPNNEGAKMAIKLLRRFLAQPTLENRHKLYTHLRSISVSTICDPFADEFGLEDNDKEVLEFARTLFYQAQHREPLKFAILLLGIYGMDRIQEKEPELWLDLITTSHCEEFTFFFLFACKLSEVSPQDVIWQIMKCTNGWGKVYAINEAECHNQEQQLWLIQNGIDIAVEYPPLSIKLVRTSKLLSFLKKGNVSYESYKGAAAIIGNLLRLLNDFPGELLEENFAISSIDVYAHVDQLLEISANYCEEAEDILDIMGISIGLLITRENENWQHLTPNQTNLLMAKCERLIFHKDWRKEIDEKLIVNGELNYSLCDLALEMKIDIGDRLFKYWCNHPKETKIFDFLLADETDERALIVILAIEIHIKHYLDTPDKLLVPLRFLRSHPGEGVGVVVAALTSPFDWPRGVAAALLEEWGHEYITPYIREKLWEARSLSMHPVVIARIDALLRGEPFNIQSLAEQMTDKKK